MRRAPPPWRSAWFTPSLRGWAAEDSPWSTGPDRQSDGPRLSRNRAARHFAGVPRADQPSRRRAGFRSACRASRRGLGRVGAALWRPALLPLRGAGPSSGPRLPRVAVAGPANQDELARNPATAAHLLGEVFDLGDRPADGIRAGDRLTRHRLAKTLDKLRRSGPGRSTWARLATRSRRLRRTRAGCCPPAIWRPTCPWNEQPIETRFRGRRVLLMPPPSAGG